jgi:Uma2 family endonuclease
MTMVVLDPDITKDFISLRRASGNDRWDEVWDGVYLLMPNPNIEHQEIAAGLTMVLGPVVKWPGLGRVFPGVNVSDQPDDWTRNYRCPDVAVYLPGNPAVERGTHWHGGPDFAVEVVSPDDRSRDKLDFYARVGVREMLLVERSPWALELYQRRGSELDLVGTSKPDQPVALASAVLPLTFRLVSGADRPVIEVVHTDGVQRWVV